MFTLPETSSPMMWTIYLETMRPFYFERHDFERRNYTATDSTAKILVQYGAHETRKPDAPYQNMRSMLVWWKKKIGSNAAVSFSPMSPLAPTICKRGTIGAGRNYQRRKRICNAKRPEDSSTCLNRLAELRHAGFRLRSQNPLSLWNVRCFN